MAPGFAIALAVLAGTAAGVTTPAATPSDALACALLFASLALAAGRGTPGRALVLAALAVRRRRARRARARARPRAASAALVRRGRRARRPRRRHRPIDGYLRADAALVEGGVRLMIDVDVAFARTPAAGRVRLAASRRTSPERSPPARRPTGRRAGGSARPCCCGGRRSPSTPAARICCGRHCAGRSISPARSRAPRSSRSSAAPGRTEWAAAARRFVRAAIAHHVPVTSPAGRGHRHGDPDRRSRRALGERPAPAAGRRHVSRDRDLGRQRRALTALVFAAMRLLLRSPRLGSLVAIGFVTAYGFVVGGEASVTRAVTAACLYLGCDARRPRAALAARAGDDGGAGGDRRPDRGDRRRRVAVVRSGARHHPRRWPLDRRDRWPSGCGRAAIAGPAGRAGERGR